MVKRRGAKPGGESAPLAAPRTSLPPLASVVVTIANGKNSSVQADLFAASVTSVVGPRSATAVLLDDFTRVATTSPEQIRTVIIGPRLATDPTVSVHLDRIDDLRLDDGAAAGSLLVLLNDRLATRTPRFRELADQAMDHRELALVAFGLCASANLVIAAADPPEPHAVFARVEGLMTSIAEEHPAPAVEAPNRETRPDLPPLEVRVLGPIQVLGGEGSVANSPKLTELIVYLAMHPLGATSPIWTAALWPERRVPSQTVANRLSEARRALGFAPDERPRLRRNGDRHYIAHTVTDWEQFCVLGAKGASPSSWRSALRLVRGRPFDELRQGSWTVLEGFVSEIEEAVVDCALRFGEVSLTSGRSEAAAWAAQAALRAAPWDERLHRLHMRAADAAGNRGGVDAILRRLAIVLEIDGDPLGGVHPETAALYAHLSRS